MKRIFYLSSFLILRFQSVYTQDRSYIQRPSLGIHVLLNAFSYQDSFHSPDKFNNRVAGIALNYLKGVTPRTELNVNLAGSFIAFPGLEKGAGDKQLLLEADASIREKLFAGSRHFNPFLQAGLGISRFTSHYGSFLPAGIGLQVDFPGETFLLFNSQYRIPLTTAQSGHFYGSFGIAGIIGNKKSRKVKKITSLPVRSFHAVAEKDTDGDGIIDSLDSCPLIAGLQAYKGCPIPDKDKDGINDEEDQCPELPGDRKNAGCPVVQNDIREKIALAAKNVFFETDRYKLLTVSYNALDEVAGILRDNPLLKLDIEGHTDNSGSPNKNKTLSERRAMAVLEYLSERAGIKRERLSVRGYGSLRPVADNNLPEGRALNRRVEFRLKYY